MLMVVMMTLSISSCCIWKHILFVEIRFGRRFFLTCRHFNNYEREHTVKLDAKNIFQISSNLKGILLWLNNNNNMIIYKVEKEMVNKIIPMMEKSSSNHTINWQMKTFACMRTAVMWRWPQATAKKRKIILMSKL